MAVWLDRRGWSTWEHAMFDFEHYEPLRQSGLTHRQACDRLDFLWLARSIQLRIIAAAEPGGNWTIEPTDEEDAAALSSYFGRTILLGDLVSGQIGFSA